MADEAELRIEVAKLRERSARIDEVVRCAKAYRDALGWANEERKLYALVEAVDQLTGEELAA